MRYLVFLCILVAAILMAGFHFPLNPALDRTSKFNRHYTIVGSFPFIGSYLLFEPKKQLPGREYPLVMALHGGYKRSLAAYIASDDENFQERYPSFVYMPITPFLPTWADLETGEPNASLENAMYMLEDIVTKYPVDRSRIYLTGSSNGAIGTYAAAANFPNIFAAAVPVNGVWVSKDAINLGNSNLWIFHGTNDSNFNIRYTRNLVQRIKSTGGQLKFTQMRDIGHDSYPAYTDPELWPWLFYQRKP